MQNMEKRKNSLTAVKMCRFCLTQTETLESLYDKNRQPKNSVNHHSYINLHLHLKILSCVSIEVCPSDKMPTFICERCKFFMNTFYEYKQIVRQADETILQYIQHGSAMEIINWPTTLTNIYRNSNKVVSTVVEGGATVQVTSHDISDTDDEDGNVYNIKIGDTPEETKTACVKVITSKDEKEESDARGTESADVEQVKTDKDERCWPCDECDCAYPLEQLLELHKSQKHRTRTVECDQCYAKFFTKYDLATHQLRHTSEMPFRCVACGKKFKRLILLKRHERHVHADLPQQQCQNCPASFLSVEQLEVHQKRHVRVLPYECSVCAKKFHEKSSLQRHIDVVHNKAPTYCCAYCPERFVSVSKLARHVRSHAGERPYPCKHCDKSFTKSHHYTRHLRLKHRMSPSSRQPESYRCEQCEDSFATQDELIYHSAIHATQNLTCPLCQEKFEDVDAVTTHIKSHVNGVEFMCDYCELVFTAKEKLDTHLIVTHGDEIQNDVYEESSMDINEDDEDENDINVKDEGDHMLIEIKKPDDFIINNTTEEGKPEATNSEESESETTYTELSTVDTLAILKKNSTIKILQDQTTKPAVSEVKTVEAKPTFSQTNTTQPSIVRKAEDVKRKAATLTNISVAEKKDKPAVKTETSNSGGASDKSLRLLEKELQDLKRTNSRPEINKNPMTRTPDTLRNKRMQIHTSTPKPRMAEERKLPFRSKSPTSDKKKEVEKRLITKENKEPKETKEIKNINSTLREEKERKEETPKSVNKNSSNGDKSNTDEGIRRSTRPSKIKNYARMIRDQTQVDDDDETSDEDEDYREEESQEMRKNRRSSSVKSSPKPAPSVTTTPRGRRKRGRPRKDTPKEVPTKIRKDDDQKDEEIESKAEIVTTKNTSSANKDEIMTDPSSNTSEEKVRKTPEIKAIQSDLLVSPSGQTLKKVPIKALPPGIKPLPLPVNARPMGTGELCEMQIGKKVVKVQKIVMTKAEVEAMAKKGLVEMKDGTMVLKQGIKLPTVDAIKPASPAEDKATEKEAPQNVSEKAAPSRCNLGDES